MKVEPGAIGTTTNGHTNGNGAHAPHPVHACERLWRDQHTHDFRHVVGPAFPHREKRWRVILIGNLDEFADGDFVVAARRARGGKDQVRLAERAVRVLFAIDNVEITVTHRFHSHAETIPLHKLGRRGDALGQPLGCRLVIVNN